MGHLWQERGQAPDRAGQRLQGHGHRPQQGERSRSYNLIPNLRIILCKDVNLSLFFLCCRPLLAHCPNSCWADWPAQAGSNRKAGRGKSMKLKLLLLYSIHTTYEIIQVTEPQNISNGPSLSQGRKNLNLSQGQEHLCICPVREQSYAATHPPRSPVNRKFRNGLPPPILVTYYGFGQ